VHLHTALLYLTSLFNQSIQLEYLYIAQRVDGVFWCITLSVCGIMPGYYFFIKAILAEDFEVLICNVVYSSVQVVLHNEV